MSESFLVFPDPAPADLVRQLDFDGYKWKAVAGLEMLAEAEPDEGWTGAIICADEDPDRAWALAREARRSEALLSQVWSYEYYGGARTVDLHVRRWRSKLGEEHASLIQTVRSVGHKLGQPGWKPTSAEVGYVNKGQESMLHPFIVSAWSSRIRVLIHRGILEDVPPGDPYLLAV